MKISSAGHLVHSRPCRAAGHSDTARKILVFRYTNFLSTLFYHPCHSLFFDRDHLGSNMGIISGPGPFAVQFGDHLRSWGPFLERPGNLTGPKSYFEIKLGCVLTPNEVYFVSLGENFTVQI